MTPNLYVVFKRLTSPCSWFRKQDTEPVSLTQRRPQPVRGVYKHVGNCWCLVARNGPDGFDVPVNPPQPVIYSRVLKRWLFKSDFDERLRRGNPNYHEKEGFFRLDDGISWVRCFDQIGEFVPGPWKLYCMDKETGHFRTMLKGDGRYGIDDEGWAARRGEEIGKGSRDSSRLGRKVQRPASSRSITPRREERQAESLTLSRAPSVKDFALGLATREHLNEGAMSRATSMSGSTQVEINN